MAMEARRTAPAGAPAASRKKQLTPPKVCHARHIYLCPLPHHPPFAACVFHLCKWGSSMVSVSKMIHAAVRERLHHVEITLVKATISQRLSKTIPSTYIVFY